MRPSSALAAGLGAVRMWALAVLGSGGRLGASVEATPREEGGSGAEGRPGNLTGEPGALSSVTFRYKASETKVKFMLVYLTNEMYGNTTDEEAAETKQEATQESKQKSDVPSITSEF